jgi:hypothetical protein
MMENLSKEKTSEDVVQEAPPSYHLLYGKSNTSEDVQSQPSSFVLTDNDQCGQPAVNVKLTPSQPIYTIESYIIWSILNILCCCCCFGFIACCFLMKTKDLKEHGDIQGALKASKTARKWNLFTTVFGITMISLQITYYMIASSST